jgi:hypothetical protein
MTVPQEVALARHATDLDDDGHDAVENLVTVETDTTLVVAPDGAGGVEFRAESGGGAAPSDDTPLVEAGAGDPGTSPDVSRSDHVHPATSASGGIGPLLISDTPSTPLVFADLLQNEAQDDLIYADV